MQAIELRVLFLLSGCRSLKEKRQRLQGLRDRFGKQTGMAVCESGYADSHQRAQWSFVAVAAAHKPATQMLDDVERYVTSSVDAEVLELRRYPLNATFDSLTDAVGQPGAAI